MKSKVAIVKGDNRRENIRQALELIKQDVEFKNKWSRNSHKAKLPTKCSSFVMHSR